MKKDKVVLLCLSHVFKKKDEDIYAVDVRWTIHANAFVVRKGGPFNMGRVSVWSGKTPAELSIIDAHIADAERFPREDAYEYSVKYLEMLQEWQKGGSVPVSSAEIERFYNDAIGCLRQLAMVDPELDEEEAVQSFIGLWPRLSGLLAERPFYEWVREYAMNSAFLYTYFVDLSGRSPALEMANGQSWDITGKLRKIPECDAAYYFRVSEPTFLSFDQRNWFSQQEMLKVAIKIGWRFDGKYGKEHPKPRKVKVAFLGGGLLPQLRLYDLDIATACEMFDITVYDRDPELPKLLAEVFGKPIEEFGIKYHNTDFAVAFSDSTNRGAYDIVVSTGMMSYYAKPEQTTFILNGVNYMLAEGGVYTYDRQIFEKSMQRCVFVLRWRGTGMMPNKSADEAIAVTKTAIEGKFTELVYEVDHYNDEPAVVNFTMIKE